MEIYQSAAMDVIRALRPTFRNANDKIAFAVHSTFASSGYCLLATGPSAFSDDALSSTLTDEVGIDQWNQLDTMYAFLYSNPIDNSKKVWVKCLAITATTDYLFVDALSQGPESQPFNLALKITDYANVNGGVNYASQYKNFRKLVRCLKAEILSRLNPITSEIEEILPARDGAGPWGVNQQHQCPDWPYCPDCSPDPGAGAGPWGANHQHQCPNWPYCPACSPAPRVVFFPFPRLYHPPVAEMYPIRVVPPHMNINAPGAFHQFQDNRNQWRARR